MYGPCHGDGYLCMACGAPLLRRYCRNRRKTMRYLLAALVMMLGITTSWAVTPTETEPIDDRIVQTVHPVVRVEIGDEVTYGSGVILYSDKGETLIVTNFHVVSIPGAITVSITKKDGTQEVSGAIVLDTNEELDLALLRVRRSGYTVAHVHEENVPLRPYDDVYLVGAGGGDLPYPSQGIVADYDSEEDGTMKLSVPIRGGDSGGAVWRRHEEHFELVGIPVQMALQNLWSPYGPIPAPVNNVAYAIKIEKVMEFVRERIPKEKPAEAE